MPAVQQVDLCTTCKLTLDAPLYRAKCRAIIIFLRKMHKRYITYKDGVVDGYILTLQGNKLCEQLQHISSSIDELNRELLRTDARLEHCSEDVHTFHIQHHCEARKCVHHPAFTAMLDLLHVLREDAEHLLYILGNPNELSARITDPLIHALRSRISSTLKDINARTVLQ